MIHKILCVFISLGLHQVYGQTLQSRRGDGTLITYRLSLANTAAQFPLVAILTGSECYSNINRFEWAKKKFANENVTVLSLEKPGISGPVENCPQEYLQLNSLDQRIADHLQIIAELKNTLPGWNRQIVWMGGSEGAMLGGVLAPIVPETLGAVLIAGGGGMTFEDELLITIPRMMREQKASEEQISVALVEFNNMAKEARANPDWTQSWGGDSNTFKWWKSVLDVKPVDALSQVEFPILMIHGDADLNSAVEASDLMAVKFSQLGKTNLEYLRLPGLDHGLRDKTGVSQMDRVVDNNVMPWLQNLTKNRITTGDL